jgi:hypothetical protein
MKNLKILFTVVLFLLSVNAVVAQVRKTTSTTPRKTVPVKKKVTKKTTVAKYNSSTNSSSYNRSQSVRDFVEGKYFRNSQTGLRVKYGYISSLNTYGITFVNSYENKFYYMNCSERLSSDEQYMELTNCMSPDDGSGIGDIDVYKDRIVINARDGSLTYYIE